MNRVWMAMIACTMSGVSLAAESRPEAALRRLDPETRFEQVCDLEAMNKIDRDKNSYHPDRAVIDAISAATINGDTMQGSGGAFRSAGKWYQFSFTCRTSPDRMKVLFFSYRVGAPIPQDEWASHGLYP